MENELILTVEETERLMQTKPKESVAHYKECIVWQENEKVMIAPVDMGNQKKQTGCVLELSRNRALAMAKTIIDLDP